MSYIQDLHPLPRKYDIVTGYFLNRDVLKEDTVVGFEDSPVLYKDTHHYLLVIEVYEERDMVMVVYGTSSFVIQKGLASNEILLEDEDCFLDFGLTKETLFRFNYWNIGILPYNNNCFKILHNINNYSECAYSAIAGRVIDPYIEDVDKILSMKKIERLKDYLWKEKLTILPVYLQHYFD